MKFRCRELIEKNISIISNHLKDIQISKESDLLNQALDLFFSTQGKELRPSLVLLCAHISGGINDRSTKAAELVAVLHAATLIHDDVVDKATFRRGLASTNTKFGNSLAVLLGDLLFTHVVEKAIIYNEYTFLRILISTTQKMLKGEFLQNDFKRKYDPQRSEKIYKDIIYYKTASFFEACCELGTLSTSNSKLTKDLKELGKCIGMAFQLKDDLKDYIPSSTQGKGHGSDFQSGIVTLPLIYALKNSSSSDGSLLLRLLGSDLQDKDFEEVSQVVKKNSGFSQTQREIDLYEQQAISTLKYLQKFIPQDSVDLFEEYFFS